jgi:hypothetical protein
VAGAFRAVPLDNRISPGPSGLPKVGASILYNGSSGTFLPVKGRQRRHGYRSF